MNRQRNLSTVNNKPKLTRVFRFFGSGSTYAFAREDLLNLQLAVVSSSTVTTRLIESVKLNGVKISCFGSSSTPTSVCLEWAGDRSPDVCYTGIATLFNPYVKYFRPPQNSLAGYYTTAGTDESEGLFTLICSEDCYLDLHVTIVYSDGSPSGTDPTLSGASPITGIVSPLLPTGAGSTLTPVGLTTDALA
jgi:hypothetical protein